MTARRKLVPYTSALVLLAGPVATAALAPDVGADQPTNIGGRVWEDLDGDGLQEMGEPGIAGVSVKVTPTDPSSTVAPVFATTDDDGRWSIGVTPGIYDIAFVDAGTVEPCQMTLQHIGADPTADSDATDFGTMPLVDVTDGIDQAFLGAGLIFFRGEISGVRWHDRNGNGLREAGEEPIAGVPVTITGGDTRGNTGSLSTTTDSDGHYTFQGLPAVWGTIEFADDPLLVVTPPQIGGDRDVDSDASVDGHRIDVFLRSSELLRHLDEGTYRPVTVRGSAWNDTDGDGLRDPEEAPATGVSVTISGTDGTGAAVERSAVTDADGEVVVGNLPPGTYRLRYEGIDAPTAAVTATSGQIVDTGAAALMPPVTTTTTTTTIGSPPEITTPAPSAPSTAPAAAPAGLAFSGGHAGSSIVVGIALVLSGAALRRRASQGG